MVEMDDLKSRMGEIFDGEIRFDEPMSEHTSLKIGGPADVMIFPEDPLSIKKILLGAREEKIPVFVLGGGTNLLVRDGGMDGIVISLRDFKSIDPTRINNEEKTVIFAGAGLPLPSLVNFARNNGLSGLEALAGIPGYLGGAVYMNAGSFGMEIGDIIESIAVMNSGGDISIVEKGDLNFLYRNSDLPEGTIILSANIALKKDDPEAIGRRQREYMKKKKASQPLGEPSAGCVFKNPEKVPAGRLIEQAGCKGLRRGDVEVSRLHANYFINRGNATGRDFMELMEIVRERVDERSGITLKEEIKVVGRE